MDESINDKPMLKSNLEEIIDWLKEHNMECNPNKLSRQYSDGVLVAGLLKKFHPKLVDMHNYPSQNSKELKIKTWETLNRKVLSKIGLRLTNKFIENLAEGKQSTIESLLKRIMLQDREIKARNVPPDEKELAMIENDDIKMVNIKKKVGNNVVQVQEKTILFSIYEEVNQENQQKEALLNALKQRRDHLQSLVEIKSERIKELCLQLGKLSMRTSGKPCCEDDEGTMPVITASIPSLAVADQNSDVNSASKEEGEEGIE